MTLFKNRQPVDSVIELPGKYKGQPYLTGGLRRVYTSGSWSENWRQWSKRKGSIDDTGSYLTCVRPYHDGKQREYHVDMSKADIQLDNIMLPQYDPLNTKYMSTKYRGHKGLRRRDLAEMIPSKLESFIESLPCGSDRYPYGGKRRIPRH